MRNPSSIADGRAGVRRRPPWRVWPEMAGAALLVAAALSVGAPSVAQADSCPNAQFRVGASAALPDCRAYEQVSAVNKRGNGVKSLTSTYPNPGWSSPDGDTVMFMPVQGPTTDNAARGISLPEVSTRSANGWTGRPAANGPGPQAVINVTNALFLYQIPDESRQNLLFMSGAPFAPDQPFVASGGNGGVYVAHGSTVDWASRPTWAGASPAQGAADSTMTRYMPVGASQDLSTSYFQTRATLTPEDGAIGRTPLANWAVYRSSNGQLTNAGVLPDGSVDPDGSVPAGLAIGGGQSAGIWNSPAAAQWNYTHSVSTDGTGLLFVSPDPAAGSSRPPQLYLAREGHPTVELSKRPDAAAAPAGTTGVLPVGGLVGAAGMKVPEGGVFGVATPDQHVVLFSTQDALTDAAEAADPAIVKTYRYDVVDQSLTYLPDLDRPEDAPASPHPNGMVFNISADGSRMLYRTEGDELRLWRQGLPTVTLSTGVGPASDAFNGGGITESRFSSDGHTLILMSKVPLRGEADHPAGGGTDRTEIYRYTEDDDHLECISCAPGITLGPAAFVMQGVNNGFGSTTFASPLASTRGMSDDGRRVFFTTTSPLSPGDHNTTADVYEWEGGTTHLLSSGATGSLGDFLLDNSPSGNDVFIVSPRVLAPTDTDDVYDVYDVRVDGGFTPPARPITPCEGDACQGAPAPGPSSFATPASVTFMGAGNLTSPSRQSHAASVRVLRRKAVRRAWVRVRVRVSGKGRIQISGPRVRRSSRNVARAGTYRVRVRLTAGGRRLLRHRHQVRTRVTVRFRSAEGGSVHARARLTFRSKRAPAHRARAANRRAAVLSSEIRKGR